MYSINYLELNICCNYTLSFQKWNIGKYIDFTMQKIMRLRKTIKKFDE